MNSLYYGIESVYETKKIDNVEEYATKLAQKYGVNKGESIILVEVDQESKKSNAMKILHV